jgi:predicted kinase
MSSNKITPVKPFIIMLYGFPGSGKTSFSRQMAEELGVIHLQEDKIRIDLFGDNISAGAFKGARKVLNYMAHDYLRAGISIIYDAGVIRASERRKVREIAHMTKATPLLVWLQADPDTTFERTQKRDHRKADDKYAFVYDEDTYRNILSHMQNPENEDYIVVSGKHTFSSQRSTVIKKLFDLHLISANELASNTVKPGLTNLIPKSSIQMRGDIIQRNVPIR